MARYLPNILFVIMVCVQVGLIAAGSQLPRWDQILWLGMAGSWAILDLEGKSAWIT